MADGSVARRYARALVDLGEESDAVDALAADLTTFAGVLDLNEGELRAALANPGITIAERRAVLDAVLSRLGLHAYVGNFLRLLMDNGRFGELPSIRTSYQSMADDRANRVRATVTSARPLDEAGADRVRASLAKATGKQVTVTFAVDPDLIGGMIARVGDTVYDASVRARLASMQQALTNGNLELAGDAVEAR